MKTYLEPETHVFQVIHSGAICTVSPYYYEDEMLGTMENVNGEVAW